MASARDVHIEKTLKAAGTFLARWRGARTELRELTISVKTLVVVLTRDEGPDRNLVISCLDPIRLHCSVRWDNADLVVSRVALPGGKEEGFLVTDPAADAWILCGALELRENVKLW